LKHLALALSLLLSMAAPASAQTQSDWRAQVLIVASLDDVQKWIDNPLAHLGADSARLREIPTGMKVHFPIVVTGLPSAAAPGMQFVADIDFLGPQGQVLWSKKSCCTKSVREPPQGQAVSLDPVPGVQFEPNDTAGTYSIRAVVSDGQRSATVVESFRFGEARPAPGPKPEGLRLQMGEPPKKNPGVDRDVRDCLELPTAGEVIKCTERK
jgi:hypothetical protein